MHIVVVRTDNLGDLLFTFPLIKLLRDHLGAEISLIAREYVRALAESTDLITRFISVDKLLDMGEKAVVEQLKQLRIDSLLMLKEHELLRKSAITAGIPHIVYRLKNFFFCARSKNKFLWQIENINFKHTGKPLHFAQRNLKYARFYGLTPNLHEFAPITDALKLRVTSSSKILNILSKETRNFLIHPGTNGNTIEWPLRHFRELISKFPKEYQIVVTGSLSEQARFANLLDAHPKIVGQFGTLNPQDFLFLLKSVDGVIANGTGPLHIAAALDTRVVGVFPAQPTISSVRWAPLGKNVKVFEAQACSRSQKNKRCSCIESIAADDVYQYVSREWFNNREKSDRLSSGLPSSNL
jgi:ADP-heptose:LPS heptosyltransferase